MSTEFRYTEPLPLGEDTTEYRSLGADGVEFAGGDLRIEPGVLTALADAAIGDIQHLLRPGHLAQLRAILDDPEASENDRYVAGDLLRNACVAAGGVLPMCQDTGTAIVIGRRTETVRTGGADAEALSRGVFDAYQRLNLRYSQQAPLDFYTERNTGTNLPAQIDIYHEPGTEPCYEFLFIAKGGGSANKTFFFQETPTLLDPDRFAAFLDEKLRLLGTTACPPYHLAIVVGGTSAEQNLKITKLASTRELDGLPGTGSAEPHAFRDTGLEQQVLELTRQIGIGAQFGGKYFCHDVRVIRLPRHGASMPVGIAVSCSADRQAKAKITPDGVFLERLETDPARYLPEAAEVTGEPVRIDLSAGMDEIRAALHGLAVGTRLALTGPLVLARDQAHARIAERLAAGEEMPEYLRRHPVYYAGPAKTPEGYASGSLGPTTAGRMDSYVDSFQRAGGSLVMLAKGNRSPRVAEACREHGGFYLGTVGGPAARLAQDCITSAETLEYGELGMEAVRRIEVVDFPAFVVMDDQGNDFFARYAEPTLQITFRR